MKKLILVFAFVLTMFGLVACGETSMPGTKTEGVLVVGMECDYAPFNWTETKKTDSNVAIVNMEGSYAEGYDVMIAKKIAEGLGLELQIKALTWNGLVPALKNGQIDLIVAGMSPTAERMKSISFTNGYYRSTHVVLTKRLSPYASATSLADFAGAKVAGQAGTLYADLVPQLVAKGAIAGTDLETVSALVNQIKQGVLDGTILEEPVAIGLAASDLSLTYAKFADGEGFEVADEDALVSIGVRKECSFIEDINTILAGISETERTALMTAAVALNAVGE